MRRTAVLACLVLSVAGPARAEPDAPPPPDEAAAAPTPADAAPDPAAGSAAPAPVDLAPANVAEHVEPRADHRVAAVATLGAMYLTFSSWAYLAWYAKHKPLGYFKWGGDGWLGDTTYAGGADKFGHAWATMGLARAGTLLLSDWGGFNRHTASLISAGLAESLFFFVEVKDGFFYEFSYSDLAGDTTGMMLALLFDNFPRLDEMFDYRVEYWPSHEYWNNVSGGNGYSRLNIAEDYSGETYLLAYHLGSIHALREQPWGTWSRFVDVTLGFGSRGYKPSPPAGYPPYEHHQDTFIGLSFNAQGFFDWLLEDRPSSAAHITRKITHGLFEMFNLPFTSQYLLEYQHHPTGTVNMGGA